MQGPPLGSSGLSPDSTVVFAIQLLLAPLCAAFAQSSLIFSFALPFSSPAFSSTVPLADAALPSALPFSSAALPDASPLSSEALPFAWPTMGAAASATLSLAATAKKERDISYAYREGGKGPDSAGV